MPIRKQVEEQVLQALQEAMKHGKRLERSGVRPEDERTLEWRRATWRVLVFAFGELSPHARAFRGQGVRGVSACLAKARRALQSRGIPNPFLLIDGSWQAPDFPLNRAWAAQQRGEDAVWRLLFSSMWFEKIKL